MSLPTHPVQHWSWTKDSGRFLVSTDPSLIPLETLNNDIFAAEDFGWGKDLPEQELRTLVERSLCFGIYEVAGTSSSVTNLSTQANDQAALQQASHRVSENPSGRAMKLIGFARFITDYVTVNYLTDVYILPSHRGQRLGAWMMGCIDEVFQSMHTLRGMILITDRGGHLENFYRKHLSMSDLKGDGFCMDRKGLGAA